jgi:predicted small lipoprotein YifL
MGPRPADRSSGEPPRAPRVYFSAMKSLASACFVVYVAGTLAACGQKGPLVLPDAPKRKHAIPSLPNSAKPNGAENASPAPAESGPATSPAPPSSTAPATPPPGAAPSQP